MCCDGTLFANARLTKTETRFAASLGLSVTSLDDGDDAFVMPCHHFRGGCCSLYQQERPQVCGGYRCAMLPAYENGTLTLDECTDLIDVVRGLTRTLEEEMGLPFESYTAAALHRFLADEHPDERPDAHQRFFMALLQLRRVGERYFGWAQLRAGADEVSHQGAEAATAAAGQSLAPVRYAESSD
jgi:hypothetical protein